MNWKCIVLAFAGSIPYQCHGLAPRMPLLPQQEQQPSPSDAYGPKRNHPTAYDESPPFKGPLSLARTSSPDIHRQRIQRYYIMKGLQLPICDQPPQLKLSSSTDTILKTIVDHLAHRDAPVDAKEVAESVEFYLRTAKRVLGAAKQQIVKKSSTQSTSEVVSERDDDDDDERKGSCIVVQDLCSGHGLTGMLFAACNPSRLPASIPIRTVLVDRFEPPSHQILRDTIAEVCPWIMKDDEAVRFIPATLEEYFHSEKQGESNNANYSASVVVVISTHACGSLTDDILRFATSQAAASIAVMPCCYTGTDKGAPYGIRRALGVSMAADVRRSFFLQDRDYHVDFATIPREVTPMNRIIVAEKR